MKTVVYLIGSLFFLFVSCKKEKQDHRLGKIDISNAYSLVLCYNDSTTDNPSDTLKLYKMGADDKLYYVRQYSEDGAFMGFMYLPVAIYDLNKEYFLFIACKNGATTTETYLISKADGTAEEVRDFEPPHAYNDGWWGLNQSNRVFITSNAQNYYYLGNNTINLLTFDEGNNPKASQVTDYSENFDIDTVGNIISGNNLIYKDGTSQIIEEIDENTVVSRNTQEGFYMIKRTPSAIQISSINISGQNYTIAAKGEISESTDGWKYLGNVIFKSTQSVVLVYDLGLVYINTRTQKVLPLSTFSLTHIESFSHSNAHLFVNGLNTLQNEVMLKINTQSGTPIFSDILVPERYRFYQYQVDENSNFTFFALDKVKSVEVIGYLSAAQNVNILDNSQKLIPRQMLSIK